ncbi:MAG: hypothetical protein P1V97_14025 [Planctomycetota bacterium]|nr:hypothetical protein [Planctomycetota bacterium]
MVKEAKLSDKRFKIYEVKQLMRDLQGPPHLALRAAIPLVHTRFGNVYHPKGKPVFEAIAKRYKELFETSLSEGDYLLSASILVWIQKAKKTKIPKKEVSKLLKQLYQIGDVPALAFYDYYRFYIGASFGVPAEVPFVRNELETPYVLYWFWKTYFQIMLQVQDDRQLNERYSIDSMSGTLILPNERWIDMLTSLGAPYRYDKKRGRFIYHGGESPYRLRKLNKKLIEANKAIILNTFVHMLYKELGFPGYAAKLPSLLAKSNLSKDAREKHFWHGLRDVDEDLKANSKHPRAMTLKRMIEISMKQSRDFKLAEQARIQKDYEIIWRKANPKLKLTQELKAAKAAYLKAPVSNTKLRLELAKQGLVIATKIEYLNHPKGGYYNQKVAEWWCRVYSLQAQLLSSDPEYLKLTAAGRLIILQERIFRCHQFVRNCYDDSLKSKVQVLVKGYTAKAKKLQSVIALAKYKENTRFRTTRSSSGGSGYSSTAKMWLGQMRSNTAALKRNNYESSRRWRNYTYSQMNR